MNIFYTYLDSLTRKFFFIVSGIYGIYGKIIIVSRWISNRYIQQGIHYLKLIASINIKPLCIQIWFQTSSYVSRDYILLYCLTASANGLILVHLRLTFSPFYKIGNDSSFRNIHVKSKFWPQSPESLVFSLKEFCFLFLVVWNKVEIHKYVQFTVTTITTKTYVAKFEVFSFLHFVIFSFFAKSCESFAGRCIKGFVCQIGLLYILGQYLTQITLLKFYATCEKLKTLYILFYLLN